MLRRFLGLIPRETTLSIADLLVAGRTVPIEINANPRARQISLRADAVRGCLRVNMPVRARLADASALIAAHQPWIAARVGRWPHPQPFTPGAMIPFNGATLQIDWRPTLAPGVRREGDRLIVGGPLSTLSGRTTRWLRTEALAQLAPATQALAAQIGQPVRKISVRDTASRWGSCARSGAISFSWRLIMAPDWVRHSVVAHEVAHLLHHNHGAEFWGLARELTGADPAKSRRWLAAHGAALHWVGRSG